MYPYIKIGNFNIQMNHIMIFVGFLVMVIFNIFIRKRENYTILKSIILSIIVNIFAITGAVLLYKIENIGNINFSYFGLSFFGTVLFLPVFMWITKKFFNKYLKINSDHWGLSIPLELAFVRLGCFFSGCCSGIVSDMGIQFATDPVGIKRIPVQIYEVFFDLILFVILIKIYENKKIKNVIYPIFMVGYSLIRFILEIFRDTEKYLLGISNGQLFSIIAFFIGLFLIIRNIGSKNEL